MLLIQLSEATAAQRRIPLHLVDATDGITPETGEATEQPQLSKNGAAFANTTATLTAIANGAYYVELTEAELDTVGVNIVRFKSANTAEFQIAFQLVAFDPYAATNLGLTALPTAAPAANGGLPTVDASNKVAGVSGNVDGSAASVTGAVGSVTGAVGSVAGNVDGSVASVVGAVGSVTGAVGSVTGAVGSVGAGGIVAATFGAGAINAAAVAADTIGASELATSAVDEIVDAVWTEAVVDHKASAGSFAKMLFWSCQRFIGNRVVTKLTGSESVKDTDESTELYAVVTTDDDGMVTQNPGGTF